MKNILYIKIIFILASINSLSLDSNWVKIAFGGDTPQSGIQCILSIDSGLYIAGNLQYTDGHFRQSNCLMKFIEADTTWVEVLDSNNKHFSEGVVFTMTYKNNNIYVAGLFDSVSTLEARSIAKFNLGEKKWYNIGDGIKGQVFSISFIDTILYAVGKFDTAGTNKCNNIAYWDGNNWENIGGGTNGLVSDIIYFDSTYYISGVFDTAGTNKCNNIAYWSGTDWLPVGEGVNGTVSKMEIFNNELYLIGSFTSSDTTELYGFAKLNGTNFEPVLDTLIGSIFDIISVDSNKLIIAGRFNYQVDSNLTLNNLAYMDTLGNLKDIGGGTDGVVSGIYANSNDLYIIGRFTKTGDIQNANIGRYTNLLYLKHSPKNQNQIVNLSKKITMNLYPNPTYERVTITIEGEDLLYATLELFDILGNKINNIFSGKLIDNYLHLDKDFKDLPNGLYYVVLQTNELNITKPLIIMRE